MHVSHRGLWCVSVLFSPLHVAKGGNSNKDLTNLMCLSQWFGGGGFYIKHILASLKEFWLSIERKSEGQSLWLWTCQTTRFCLFFCDYLTRVSEVQSLKILATDRRKDCGVLQIQQRQTSLFLKTWQHSDRAANDEDTAYRQAAQCWNSWNIQINTWAPHEVLRLNVDSRYLQY